MNELVDNLNPVTSIERRCDVCGKKNCFINKYCDPKWRALLSKYKKTYFVPAGELIFTKGNDAKGIYCVYSGYIKVFNIDGTTESIVDLITGGQVLGYREIGTKNSTYTVSAKALSTCEITFFPFEIFNLAIESNSKLLFYLLDLFTEKLKMVENRLKNFQNMHVKEKIICAINDIIRTFGFDKSVSNRLSFTLSRKDIADMAGTTYETVIRVLSDLDKQEVIKLDGKFICILNRDFFEKCETNWK